MLAENARRRPAGTASISRSSVGKTHEGDERILTQSQREFDGQPPRPITWTDADSERVSAFIAQLVREVRP